MKRAHLKRALGLMLATGLLLTMAAGCTGGETKDAGTGAAGAGGGLKPKIAFIMKTMNHPFWADMKDAAQAKADELGYDIYFDGPDRETETEKQVQMIENAIVQKVDAVICGATDSKALVDVVKKCNDAGIVFITVDGALDQDSLDAAGAAVATTIGSNNYEGGKMVGEYFKSLFADETGKIEVAIIEGVPGMEAAIHRKTGFEEVIATDSRFEIVASQPGNWESELGMSVAQNMLQANPNLKAIFAANDNMGLGAIEAIRAANKLDQVKVVSFDGIADALDSIERGEITATIGQYPKKMGEIGVTVASELIQDPHASVEPIYYADIEVVDQSNLGDYRNG